MAEIAKLGKDVQHHIHKFLLLKEVCYMSCVNKFFLSSAISSSSIWLEFGNNISLYFPLPPPITREKVLFYYRDKEEQKQRQKWLKKAYGPWNPSLFLGVLSYLVVLLSILLPCWLFLIHSLFYLEKDDLLRSNTAITTATAGNIMSMYTAFALTGLDFLSSFSVNICLPLVYYCCMLSVRSHYSKKTSQKATCFEPNQASSYAEKCVDFFTYVCPVLFVLPFLLISVREMIMREHVKEWLFVSCTAVSRENEQFALMCGYAYLLLSLWTSTFATLQQTEHTQKRKKYLTQYHFLILWHQVAACAYLLIPHAFLLLIVVGFFRRFGNCACVMMGKMGMSGVGRRFNLLLTSTTMLHTVLNFLIVIRLWFCYFSSECVPNNDNNNNNAEHQERGACSLSMLLLLTVEGVVLLRVAYQILKWRRR